MPRTTIGHGKMPYPKGTLVEDTVSERTGFLMGVVEERTRERNELVSAQAFMRPEGGGPEWDVPVERIRPFGGPQ